MAVYQLGDILRMKREALGITREKLCEMSNEICSSQTLYRMECGKVKVKQETYSVLMRCMGELSERNYSSIIVSKYQALNLKSEIHTHLIYKEYEQVEEKLWKLEQVMPLDDMRNRQYLLERKATLTFRQKKITPDEYQKLLFDALRCTIPDLDKINIADWPYNEEEFSILMYILNTYHAMKCKDKELELLLKLKENLERRYMEEKYYVVWHATVISNLAIIMSGRKEYEKAEEYCLQGINECKEQRILGIIGFLFLNRALNIQYQKEDEFMSEKERELCKKFLVQAYFLSIAQKEDYRANRIKEVCERYYPGEIKLL